MASPQLLANAEPTTTAAAVTPCQLAHGEQLLVQGMGSDGTPELRPVLCGSAKETNPSTYPYIGSIVLKQSNTDFAVIVQHWLLQVDKYTQMPSFST